MPSTLARARDVREPGKLHDDFVAIRALHRNQRLDDAQLVDPPIDGLLRLLDDFVARDIGAGAQRLVDIHAQLELHAAFQIQSQRQALLHQKARSLTRRPESASGGYQAQIELTKITASTSATFQRSFETMDHSPVEHTQTHHDQPPVSGELRADQIRSGIERRCGERRDACRAGDDSAIARLGRRQATERRRRNDRVEDRRARRWRRRADVGGPFRRGRGR